MKRLIVTALLVLAACGASALADAERRYAVMESNGADVADLCLGARKAASAAADVGDGAAFREWKATGNIQCAAAARGETVGTAENMDAP